MGIDIQDVVIQDVYLCIFVYFNILYLYICINKLRGLDGCDNFKIIFIFVYEKFCLKKKFKF